jgi:hypothetical protein
MTESKSQDKYFPYPLKQEGFENFGWAPLENDMDDLRNSNSFLLNKFNNRSQLFGEFNPLSINPDINNDQISIANQSENQNILNDQNEQSVRTNSNYPLFNEKLLANSNTNSEVGMNPMKTYSSILMSNMNNINKMQTYPVPNNYYFPFNNNNLRRPLPQELLEEEPVYVNPKQYERIMKLRIKKAQKGMLKNSVVPLERPKDKSYKHLSRHLHAKRRERGTGGRFLSKEAQKKKQQEEGKDEFHDLDEMSGLGDHHDFDTIRKDSGNNE